MSAKQSKKSSGKNPAPAAASPLAAPVGGGAATAGSAPAETTVAWIDSNDPRRRTIAKVVFVGVWIYVGALWLLALDQTFNWGIFGPKIPPIP